MGAVHVIVAVVVLVLMEAVPMVGAKGVAYGMTDSEDDEYDPVPIELYAATVNVYEVP